MDIQLWSESGRPPTHCPALWGHALLLSGPQFCPLGLNHAGDAPNTFAATSTLLFLIWINEAGNTRVLIGLALFCGMSATLAPE